jgi:hypothetical protein
MEDPMNVETLLLSVANELEPIAREAHVRLSVRCDGGVIGFGATEIAQSIYVIVANVIRGTTRGGAVVLDVRKGAHGIASWVAVRVDGNLTRRRASFDGRQLARSLASGHDARTGRLARRAA